jgi:hypothetical protein
MLKMALILDERVKIVLLSGCQGWCMLSKSEIFVTIQTVVLLSIPNMYSKISTNMIKRVRKCVVSG